LKKCFKYLIFIFILLMILPSCSLAVSPFKNIDINSLNLNSIDTGKIDDLKATLENISKEDFSSSTALERY
jgi:hypothetical protein